MTDNLNLSQNHPCYSQAAAHQHARIHLPVAMHCNISCNYCNRKYDCLNESRPGVTSEVITPMEALHRFKYYKEQISNLSVVGIAGPGDALADWEQSSHTMRLIRACDPDVYLCLSTNGLKLPYLTAEIAALGVTHVTVTVNTLNPETGASIYRYVNYQGQRYTGSEGAGLLLQNQLAGIQTLTSQGIMVKVNIVMIPGINELEIPDIVRQMKKLNVFVTNIMPLIPVKGSAFAEYPATSTHDLMMMRRSCQLEMRQMFHCRQCRADAVGLLKNNQCQISPGKQAG